MEPEFKTLASLMDALLSRPEGVAWSVLVAKAKAYSDKHGLTTSVTVGLCRAHAKFRARKDGVTFVDDGEIGKLVLNSDHPLGRKELVERVAGTRRNRRDLPGTAPVKYEPRDYDIGDGCSYVYAYYFPEYRKKGEVDFPIKIGRSIEYRGRIETQSRATGMPEEPEVAVVWRTDKPVAAERLLHEYLKFRGKHKTDSPGTEWFQTSPDEIRQIIESIHPGVSIRSILPA